jgi:hypothetical protein
MQLGVAPLGRLGHKGEPAADDNAIALDLELHQVTASGPTTSKVRAKEVIGAEWRFQIANNEFTFEAKAGSRISHLFALESRQQPLDRLDGVAYKHDAAPSKASSPCQINMPLPGST